MLDAYQQWIQLGMTTIAQTYKNHLWLSTRVILAAKNVDFNEIYFQIKKIR